MPARRPVLCKPPTRFNADIQVENNGKTANAKSINQVATLNARQGDTITINGRWPRCAWMHSLRCRRWLPIILVTGMKRWWWKRPCLPATAARKGELTGIPASAGIAIGPAFQYRPRLPQVETHTD